MKRCVLLVFAILPSFAQADVARVLNDRGLAAYDRGDFAEAEQLHREAIARYEALGPAFAPHVGITRMNLGQALSMEGRRRDAMTELQASVSLLRGSLGPRHIDTLMAMNLLAALDLMMGDLAAAESLLGEALPAARAIDPHGVQLVRALVALACLRMRRRQFDEATALADEAIPIAIEASGETGFDTALAYGATAEIHRAAGRPERALPLFRHARAIYEARGVLGETRAAALLTQESLILIDEHKFGLAEQQLKQSVAILDRACPRCALEHWNAESALGILRSRQGKYAEADRLLTSLLAAEESSLSLPSAELADTLNALAFVRRKERLFDDADRLTHRAATLLPN